MSDNTTPHNDDRTTEALEKLKQKYVSIKEDLTAYTENKANMVRQGNQEPGKWFHVITSIDLLQDQLDFIIALRSTLTGESLTAEQRNMDIAYEVEVQLEKRLAHLR